MPAILKPILQYLVYPLALKAAQWIAANIIVGKVDDSYKERKEERRALMSQIQKCKDKDKRRALSRVLYKLELGELPVPNTKGILQSPRDSAGDK